MITRFGKFLRKLRIDNDETMIDMAEKLKVSSAFLSKVERGKKIPPSTWYYYLLHNYNLNDTQLKELDKLIFYERNIKYLEMELLSYKAKEHILDYAYKDILKGGNKND